MSDTAEDLAAAVERYYSAKVQEFGPTPPGVDWRDGASQRTRFDVLLQVLGDRRNVKLLDFGCGYGALLDHAIITEQCATYTGLDVSFEMVHAAQLLHDSCGYSHPKHEFVVSDRIHGRYEVIVASGVFNVKLETPDAAWRQYIRETVAMIADNASVAFAYNCLSMRSDPGKRRNDLHYADPREHVAFLTDLGLAAEVADDYGLYEFTILARR